VLDWTNDHPGAHLATSKIAEDIGVEAKALEDPLLQLAAEDLVKVSAAGGTPVYLAVMTPKGVGAARSQREQVQTRSARLAACSDALLDWLNRYDGERMLVDIRLAGDSGSTFTYDVRANIYGVPFSAEDVRATTKSLVDNGLVKGIRTAQGPRSVSRSRSTGAM
jgi:hypothetical protein